MKTITEEIAFFLEKQHYTIVSTIDAAGGIHCAAKGIVGIEKNKLYLIDLYKQKTFENIQRNPTISITAIDEHHFRGYTLKGKAKIEKREKIEAHIIKKWESAIIRRITTRVIKNVQGESGSQSHPEVYLPPPQYLIVVDISEIIDLTPGHIKKIQFLAATQ